MQLNRAENTGTSNPQVQELFLQKAEEHGRLAQDASITLIDAFLQNLTTLLTKTTSIGYHQGTRSLKILNSFVQADERVRSRFNPSR